MNPGLAGLGAALGWGTGDFIARFNSRAIGSDRTVMLVLGLSCIFLTPMALSEDLGVFSRAEALWLVGGASLATVAVLWLLYETLSRGPLSIIVPILACYPAPLVIWATLFDGLEVSLPLAAAMLVTFAGVWIVARAGHRTQHKDGHALGRLSVTLAMTAATIVVFDIYVVVMDRTVAQIGNIPAIWSSRLGAFAIMAMLALVRRQGIALPAKNWGLLGAQSAVDTFGFIMLFTATATSGGTALATVASSAYGVVTVVLARLFLREIISPQGWLGMALVFGGVVGLSLLS